MSTTSNAVTPPPSFYFEDEKWKLSKKVTSSRSRSFSSDVSNMRYSSSASSSRRRCAFTRKCVRLVQEQRARFYIMRRCVSMLVCWRDCGDS